jgi:hypothetical protein
MAEQKYISPFETINALTRERDEARAEAAAFKASYETVHSEATSMAANQCLHGLHGDEYGNPYCPGITEAERRGYLKGLNDALTAIHEPDILWAHARAIEALKAKVKE